MAGLLPDFPLGPLGPAGPAIPAGPGLENLYVYELFDKKTKTAK